MTDRSVRVTLEAVTSRYEASMARAGAATAKVGSQIQQSGAAMQRFGSGANRFGNRMTLGYSLPMIALGKRAIDTAVEFQKSMNTMAAVAGVPGPELEKLRKLAIKLGQDTVFSANEAAEAELELAKSGLKTADILGGALKNTLDLATAGDMDLAEAAGIAATAMSVFNLNGKQSQIAVDALSGAANASKADVSDLAMALSQGALAASRAGLNVQETTAALAAFSKAGLEGSDAGTSLKTFLLNLVPTSIKAKDMMKELGVSFVDANGNIKSLADIAQVLQDRVGGLTQAQQQVALKTMFGTDAFRAASVIMEQGAKGIERYTRATSKQGNASDVAKAKMKGLPGVMESLSGSIDTALLKLGDEELEGMVTDIAGGIQDAIQAFSDLSPEMRHNIVKWAALGTALGPVAKLVGGISSGLGGIVKLGGAAAGAIAKIIAASAGGTVAGAGAGAGGTAAGAGMAGLGVGGALTVPVLGVGLAAAGGAGIAGTALENNANSSLDDIIVKGVNATDAIDELNSGWQKFRRAIGSGNDSMDVGVEGALERHRDFVREVTGGTVEAIADYELATTNANGITVEQARVLGESIRVLHDLDGDLTMAEVKQINAALAAGKFNRAMKIMHGALTDLVPKNANFQSNMEKNAQRAEEAAAKAALFGAKLGLIPNKKSVILNANISNAVATISNFRRYVQGLPAVSLSVAARLYRTDQGLPTHHVGGEIGQTTARRFGGVRGDEVPVILQRGERVLSRAQATQTGDTINIAVDARGSQHTKAEITEAVIEGLEAHGKRGADLSLHQSSAVR